MQMQVPTVDRRQTDRERENRQIYRYRMDFILAVGFKNCIKKIKYSPTLDTLMTSHKNTSFKHTVNLSMQNLPADMRSMKFFHCLELPMKRM